MPNVRRSNRVKSKKNSDENKSSPCPSPAKLNVKSKTKVEGGSETDPLDIVLHVNSSIPQSEDIRLLNGPNVITVISGGMLNVRV